MNTTTYEKAKAYDKVFQKVKDFFEGKQKMYSDVKQTLEYLFPELAESEDERIRKDIISYLQHESQVKRFIGDIEYDKWVAWLEKQGEQKPAWSEEDITNYSKVLFCLQTLTFPTDNERKELITWLKKQCEQKPTDKVEPKFKVKYAGSEYNVLEVKDIAGVTYYGIEDEPNHIDYVKADNCEIISDGYGIKENGSPYPTKPAVFSEQKTAWSEEDEEILITIFSYFKVDLECTDEDDIVKWLKSLKNRVQPHWKPTDRQLSVLQTAIKDYGICAEKNVLESLYYNLKKL